MGVEMESTFKVEERDETSFGRLASILSGLFSRLHPARQAGQIEYISCRVLFVHRDEIVTLIVALSKEIWPT